MIIHWLHHVWCHHMNHDNIDFPRNILKNAWVAKSAAINDLPLGLFLVWVNISRHLDVHSTNIIPISICSSISKSCCVGDSGIKVSAIATCEISREDLVEEWWLTTLGPWGAKEPEGEYRLGRLHKVSQVVEQVCLLCLVLADQQRSWVNDGIPLQQQCLHVIIAVKQHQVEQVLWRQPQIDALLGWLELLTYKVDQLL